ncbi:MAG TPA: DUF6569 family protein [Kofleriaceae bacterium]|nr:DUF6569 family protein [Kofleriaceae bacterium]
MLDPIQVDSLTVTPIVTTAPAADDKDKQLLVLDEAMPRKLVHIKEVEGGEVNSLTLTNNATQPLFLLAGEVIIGGKQDRIIGRNTIIPAKTTQDVPVFCVEHGRWTGKTGEFTTARALAHGRLRGNASFESQEDVWDEVHAKNVERKTTSDTDTYRAVAAEEAGGRLGKMEETVDSALAKLPADQQGQLVGFAVAINGEVQTVDVFQSHALFAKLETKLVRSYIADAVDVTATAAARPPKADAYKAFVEDSDKAAAVESFDTKAAHTYVKKGVRADNAEVRYDDAPAAAAPVYRTYEAKKK